METKINPVVRNFNKPAYVVFILVGSWFLIQKDISQAVIFWGLALVFDPFDIQKPFNKRPVYQQVWLVLHLSITLALFVLDIMGK